MKTLVILLLGLGFKAQAQAVTEKVIRDFTSNVNVELNANTVSCKLMSFINSSLIVEIPAIDYFAHLKHNTTVGRPNLSAGHCNGGLTDQWFSTTDSRIPLLTAAPLNEEIKLRIRQMEVFKNYKTRCTHDYKEEVSTTIRGVVFSHTSSIPLADVDVANCK